MATFAGEQHPIGVNSEQSLNTFRRSVANADQLRERVTGVLWTRVKPRELVAGEFGTADPRSSACRCGLRYRMQGIYHGTVSCVL
jgi:hypothetical protein